MGHIIEIMQFSVMINWIGVIMLASPFVWWWTHTAWRKASPHQGLCNVASLRDVFAVLFICHTDPLFCYHFLRMLYWCKIVICRRNFDAGMMKPRDPHCSLHLLTCARTEVLFHEAWRGRSATELFFCLTSQYNQPLAVSQTMYSSTWNAWRVLSFTVVTYFLTVA